MNFELLYPGAFAALEVTLENGESVKAESGAMVSMSETIDVDSKMEGGLFGGLARKFLTGESLFLQTLKAERGNGKVVLAPAFPGDLSVLELDGQNEYIIQKSGFLAAEESVNIDTKMQNIAKGFFSGEGFFIMKATGEGKIAICCYGAIHKEVLTAGQTLIVDNGHLVAWSAETEYSIEKASKGIISSVTSGEGLVCRFSGPGEIYIQTRNPGAFGSWIHGLMPKSASAE